MRSDNVKRHQLSGCKGRLLTADANSSNIRVGNGGGEQQPKDPRIKELSLKISKFEPRLRRFLIEYEG